MKLLYLGATLALCLAPACVSSGDGELGNASDGDYGVGGDRAPNVRTLHTMSRVLASQGRDGQCEIVLNKLIREHPDFMPAYVELAELLMRDGRKYDATTVLSAAVQRKPGDPVIQNDLGMTLLLGGDHEGALKHFTIATELTPTDARSRANRATALGLLDRYDEALEEYLEIVPPADAHYNLGILAESNGDGVRAAREFAISDAYANGEYEELFGAEARQFDASLE